MRRGEHESASLNGLLTETIAILGDQHPSAFNDGTQNLDTVMMRRRQIRTLRHEISALSQQVKERTENQLLQESLDRLMHGPSASSTWKHAYVAERHRRRHAEAEKERLTQRASAYLQLLAKVKKLIRTQRNGLAAQHFPSPSLSLLPSSEDSRLFLHMKANLDQRQQRLHAIFLKCAPSLNSARQHKISLHANGRGAVAEDAGILPFDAQIMSQVMLRYIHQHPHVSCYGANDIFLGGSLTASEAGAMFSVSECSVRGLQYRSLFRPIVLERCTLLLWETVTDWDNSRGQAEPQKRRLIVQGWAVVRSLQELGSSMSSWQTSISAHIYASDGSETSMLEPQAMIVLQSLKAHGTMQVQAMENMLIDSSARKPRSILEL